MATLRNAPKEQKNTDRARMGVDKLHYALVTSDDSTGLVYSEMVSTPNTISVSADISNVEGTLYADNKAVIVYRAVGTAQVTINQTTLPEELKAIWLGNKQVGGVRYVTNNSNAPYLGVAFRILYNDGTYVYVKLFKGMFSEPSLNVTSKTESVEFQTETIEGEFIPTQFEHTFTDGAKQVKEALLMAVADETSEGYKDEGLTWFDSMYPISTTPPTEG